MNGWKEFELWEGNIIWNLPSDVEWTDARTLRDFPQNQEVFMAPLTRGDAFICDVMECAKGAITPVDALKEHWIALLEANEGIQQGELMFFSASVAVPGDRAGKLVDVPCLMGQQVVGGVLLTIWMAVVRILEVQSDVVITWNQPPTAVNPNSEAIFREVLQSIRWVDISFMAGE